MTEDEDREDFRYTRPRECEECSHFDAINMCCWQAGPWGLCFDVDQFDLCHLGYEEVEDE